MCQISFEMLFPTILAYVVTMATKQTFRHCWNVSCTSSPQGQHLYQISIELLLKCFVFHVRIICRYHGNAHSATVQKCVMHIYTSRPTCVPNLIQKCFFPTIFGIICRYQPSKYTGAKGELPRKLKKPPRKKNYESDFFFFFFFFFFFCEEYKKSPP